MHILNDLQKSPLFRGNWGRHNRITISHHVRIRHLARSDLLPDSRFCYAFLLILLQQMDNLGASLEWRCDDDWSEPWCSTLFFDRSDTDFHTVPRAERKKIYVQSKVGGHSAQQFSLFSHHLDRSEMVCRINATSQCKFRTRNAKFTPKFHHFWRKRALLILRSVRMIYQYGWLKNFWQVSSKVKLWRILTPRLC